MPRPDEGLIHEWLDGELGPEESERVARLVAEDAEWAAAAAEARGLIAASSRILSALDAVPAGVMPAGSRAVPPAKPRSVVRPWMRAAAGLVFVAGTAYLVVDRTDTPVLAPPSVSEDAARQATSSAAPAPAPPPAVAKAPDRPAEERALSDVAVTSTRDAARETIGDVARERSAARIEESGRAALRARTAAVVTATEAMSGFSAKAAGLRALEGCWRTATAAGADSVVATPTIVRSRGDTLELLVGAPTRPATVVRTGDALLGEMTDASGVRAPFRASRIECPSATPSPR